MSKVSIKKNFAYQMVYEVLVLILPFVTSPYISRVIGPEGLGIYSYSYSIAYYFVLFSLLGIKNYGNRLIAQVRDDQTKLKEKFTNIFAVHALFSVVCCVVYIGYVALMGDGKIYAIIMGAYVLSGFFDISWFYFGIEKFKLTVTINTIIKIISVICIFTFVRDSNDVWLYCVIMSIGFLLSQIALWVPLHNYVRFVKPNWKEMFVHVKPLIILFIPAVAVSLYKYMDKIMIGILSSNTQLGYYENSEKVINMPLTIISSFGIVMLPKMSNLAKSANNSTSLRYIKLSIQFVMCLAVGLTFGLAGVAMVFAPVFWGNGFRECGHLIIGLALTIPFIAFANVIRTQYLIPNSKDKEYLISVIAGALINLLINLTLIPRYGAYGAVIGTIVAEVLVCIIQVFTVRNELPVKYYIKLTSVYLPVGVIMFVLIHYIGKLLGTHISTLIIQVGIGGCLYLLISFIYFYITKNEVFMNSLNSIKTRSRD